MDMDAWVNGHVGVAATAADASAAASHAQVAASDARRSAEDVSADSCNNASDSEAHPPVVARRSKDLRDDLPSLATLKDAAWVRRLSLSSRKLVSQLSAAPDNNDDNAHRRNSTDRESPSQSPHKPEESVLVPAYDDDILATLDPRFFTESFDAVAHMLDVLPTSHAALDTFLRTEISAVDVARDEIVAKLAADVRANQEAFIQGMKQVQEVDLDLVRAQIHVTNGRRLLLSAKNDLLLSSLEIVKIKRNRDRVNEIIHHGNQVLRYFDEEQRMNDALQANHFTTAVDICISLRQQLASANLATLHILKPLAHRVHDFIPELRQQFDRSLRDVAEHFEPLQYRELLQAYITLAEHSTNLGFEFSSSSLSSVLASIPDVVVRCMDDLTRASLSELFMPSTSQSKKTPTTTKSTNKPQTSPRASQTKPKKKKKKAKAKRASPSGTSSNATLTTAARAVDDVTRGFERLTELMHTYYLLVQWHRDPFNPRNDDVAYLHRCGIDDDDDSDDDASESDDGSNASDDASTNPTPPKLLSPRAKQRSSSVSSERASVVGPSPLSTQQQQRSPYNHVLCATGMTLLRYRKIVWENMQQTVMEVLDRMDMTYGFKMEHIIALSHATSTFIEIGEEFIGTTTTRLRSCIRTTCEQYLNALHDDNMELMRMLLDTENWQRVLLPPTFDLCGDTNNQLLHVIETRSGYRFAKKARDEFALHPIYTRRVFPTFHVAGNPFNDANSRAWLSLENGIRFQYETTATTMTKCLTTTASAVATDESDRTHIIDNQHVMADAVIANGDSALEIVFNSSTLAGFVRFCGVYLKMMEHLPAIAYDILQMLNRIFEFYAYAVFTSFTDRDALLELLQSRNDDNDDSAEYWRWGGLKYHMSRIADEMLAGETLLQTVVTLSATSPPSQTHHAPQAHTRSRRNNNNNNAPTIEKTVTLRRITRVPAALEDASERNLFALAERCIACEVVSAQVHLLRAIESTARSYLPERFHCLMDELYTRNTVIADELRSFTFHTLAAQLVDPPSLLDAIERVAWDIAYMRERPNEYVVAVVQKCGEAWGGLQILADGSIPVAARDAIWSAIVQLVMETLLRGFSSVSTCTPQGRALMSMDLHALQNGLDLINHVSATAVPRGREYVNRYIKAFYYDDANDVLAWIKDHKDAYTKLQFVNLIRHGVGPKMDRKELRAFVLQVDDVLTASP